MGNDIKKLMARIISVEDTAEDLTARLFNLNAKLVEKIDTLSVELEEKEDRLAELERRFEYNDSFNNGSDS